MQNNVNMRKLLFVVLLLLGSMGISAQLTQTWVGMPDSICPYLSTQHRKHMIDAAIKGTFDTIPNLLEGKSYVEMVDIQQNAMRVRMTENMTMEITCDESSVTVIQTICAPICSTLTRVYTTDWVLTKQEISQWDPELTEEEQKQYF